VAHALGTIEGLPYSNTLEAFQRSYALGFRLFEVDLALLADGSVVAARAGMERYYGFDKTFGETSLQEFERSRFYGRYTPLTGLRLLQLMEEHKEVRIIADSKSDHSALIAGLTALGKERRYWSALDRIIPHVGSEEELEGFQRIYPFPDFMFAVYRSRMSDDEIVAFIKRRKLLAAMMDWRGGRTPALIERLQQFGVVCYVHSLRDERRIARFRSQAVGVYSDGFFPSADESAGLEVKADTGAGQFEEKTARKLITVSSPEVRNGSVYRLYVRGFERRFVEVRFRLDDRPAHVFLALLDEQGSIEYTISPETARGHYRFEAVRETSERQWRRSEPPAELLVR
jgi:glycerophosphoryl diester phosphodiesterase